MPNADSPDWFVAREGRVEPTTEAKCRPVWARGGTYTLVLALSPSRTVSVGALGPVTFPAGAYAYTGSARGSGGFSRVDRHRELVAGDRESRHWHVDYLSGLADTRLDAVYLAPDVDVECDVALADGPVDGFGSSDCDCRSHLGYRESRERLRELIRHRYERLPGD